MSSDSIVSVYSDARTEYTKQLCVFLVPAYFQFFIDLLEKCKKNMVNEPKRVLWQFQTCLNEIHDWNMEKVNNEIHQVHMNCGCDYLEDLLTAVFIAHTKVLTAIRLSSNHKKIEITVPKVEHFLFKVMCETSKLLWSSTYLFRDGISGIEKQQNYRTIESILNEGILLAIRNLVPVKSILKSFVNNDVVTHGNDTAKESTLDEDSDDDDIKEKDVSTIRPADISIIPSVTPSAAPSVPSIAPSVPSIAPSAALSAAPVQNITEDLKIEEPVNQTIFIEEKPTVRFGEFNAMFDSEHPDKSDMIPDTVDDDDDSEPVIDISDDPAVSLASGVDFINLDDNLNMGGNEQIAIGDYEEL